MNWLDIAILATLGLASLVGLQTGLLNTAASLIGILVGISVASRYGGDVGDVFSRFTDNENALEVAGFLVLFFASLLAAVMVAAVARKLLRLLLLGWLDRVGGLVLGGLLAAAGISALLATIQGHPVLGLENTIAESPLGSFLVDEFDEVLRWLKIMPDQLTL